MWTVRTNDATLVATSHITLHALKFTVILFTEIEFTFTLLKSWDDSLQASSPTKLKVCV